MTKRSNIGFWVGCGVAAPLLLLICGIVAAIGIPKFAGYVTRSKTSEATSNLHALYTGAASYYVEERFSVSGPTATRCSVDPSTTSNQPSADRTSLDTASDPSFTALGFSPPAPVYYRYSIQAAPSRCDYFGREVVYTFVAIGDLDGDERYSRFTQRAMNDPRTNELMRTPNVEIEDELE
jgi:Tfp pilus assembly protein PilE